MKTDPQYSIWPGHLKPQSTRALLFYKLDEMYGQLLKTTSSEEKWLLSPIVILPFPLEGKQVKWMGLDLTILEIMVRNTENTLRGALKSLI